MIEPNRKKIFLQGAVSNYGATSVSIIVNLISVPIGLHYFGPVLYGIWLVIGSILWYLRMSDFGLGAATVTLMAQSNDPNTQQSILRRSIGLLVIISAVLIPATIILTYLFPEWISIIGKIPLMFRDETSSALLAIIVLTLFQLPMTIFLSAFSGLQQVHWNRVYGALHSIVALSALITTILVHGNLTTLAIFTGIGSILIGVISGIHLFFANPQVHPRRTERVNNTPSTKFLVISGIRFFTLQIAVLIILNTDNLIISHSLGPEKVTAYGVTFKFFYMLLTIIGGLIVALWPMYGQAFGKGDWAWIQRTYNSITLPLLTIGGLVWIGGIIFSEIIIKFWAGSAAYGGLVVAFALGGYVYLSSFTSSNVSIANALNPTNIVVIFGFIEAALNLGLSLLLVKHLGIGGVALGTFIAALITSSWFYPLYIRYRSSKKIIIETGPIITNGFIVILFVILALLTVIYLPEGWTQFVMGFVIVLLYLVLSWQVMPTTLRNLIKNTVKDFQTHIMTKKLQS